MRKTWIGPTQSFPARDQNGKPYRIRYSRARSDEPATFATEGQTPPLIHSFKLPDGTPLRFVRSGVYETFGGTLQLRSNSFPPFDPNEP
jgi:hypothetical protein